MHELTGIVDMGDNKKSWELSYNFQFVQPLFGVLRRTPDVSIFISVIEKLLLNGKKETPFGHRLHLTYCNI